MDLYNQGMGYQHIFSVLMKELKGSDFAWKEYWITVGVPLSPPLSIPSPSPTENLPRVQEQDSDSQEEEGPLENWERIQHVYVDEYGDYRPKGARPRILVPESDELSIDEGRKKKEKRQDGTVLAELNVRFIVPGSEGLVLDTQDRILDVDTTCSPPVGPILVDFGPRRPRIVIRSTTFEPCSVEIEFVDPRPVELQRNRRPVQPGSVESRPIRRKPVPSRSVDGRPVTPVRAVAPVSSGSAISKASSVSPRARR